MLVLRLEVNRLTAKIFFFLSTLICVPLTRSILRIDVTFHCYMFERYYVVLNVLIKNEKPKIIGSGG